MCSMCSTAIPSCPPNPPSLRAPLPLKPVASGSGLTCSIILAEPNIFLSGFDYDGQRSTSMLRGKLQLHVSKSVKIKAVRIKLLGRARTDWPKGMTTDLYEEEVLQSQALTFFDAMNDGWESDYGNQCTYRLMSMSPKGTKPATRSKSLSLHHHSSMNVKEMRRLSIQSVQSRSSDEDSAIATEAQAKGYKIFYPGKYHYSFEFPIEHHQPETTKLQFGCVKWELHVMVDRAGVFSPNLHGIREVPIVRVPDQLSLVTTEPISISRQFEDQLHYDIVVSGKSFPIGGRIPITFKVTPLAKIQAHEFKVFVTETIEYYTKDRSVSRKDPICKIVLLYKTPGKELGPSWTSSHLRTVRGGELTPEHRRVTCETATGGQTAAASRRHSAVHPLPEPADNLLDDMDFGPGSFCGSTEMEAELQIPTCETMAKKQYLRLHPDCSWKSVSIRHQITVMMRISSIDPDDPTGRKRRQFDIGINSPFTILNCRATQANTNLPAYPGEMCQSTTYQSTCGCPDALKIQAESSLGSSIGRLPGVNLTNENHSSPPLSTLPSVDMVGAHDTQPIHFSRVPIFKPPAFDDSVTQSPTPELVDQTPQRVIATSPPSYDDIIGTRTVDGLSDYFARLANYDFNSPAGDEI